MWPELAAEVELVWRARWRLLGAPGWLELDSVDTLVGDGRNHWGTRAPLRRKGIDAVYSSMSNRWERGLKSSGGCKVLASPAQPRPCCRTQLAPCASEVVAFLTWEP